MVTEEQVKEYCEKKVEKKALDDIVDSMGNNIKKELVDSNETKAEFGKYSVRLETRTSESFDETKLLSILERDWLNRKGEDAELPPYIRVARHVDMNELEKALYNDEIPQDTVRELDTCRVQNTTTALKYKIAKGK